MKYIKIFIPCVVSLLCLGMVISSCEKTFDLKINTDSDVSSSATVQVIVATVNASRNYLYVDTKPVNGSSLISGSVFPGTGYGFNVDAGLKAFLVRDTLAATTQVALSFAQNLAAGKLYTLFMYDTITTPKQKIVETVIEVPSDTTARLRFANFIYNPTALPAFDIFSKKRNQNIFTNVQVTDVTNFIPIASGITDTFYIRQTGTTTNLQNRNPTSGAMSDIIGILTPTTKRSYTLLFRGGFRASSTTATTVRTLSLYVAR